MATNFPGSLDSFTNPTSGSTLDSPSHAGQHANINDAMEAVQAKLGTGAGTIGEWTAFTPSWTNFTPGNATETWWYAVINDVLHVTGRTVLGTTSSVTGAVRMNIPTGTMFSSEAQAVGVLSMRDAGANKNYAGIWQQYDVNKVAVQQFEVFGTLIESNSIDATNPFSWTNNDQIRGSFTVHLS